MEERGLDRQGLGPLVIALVLCGVRPTLPKYGWGGAGDLTGGVLGPGNLAKILFIDLGRDARARSVEVTWPGGRVERFRGDFAADSSVLLREGTGRALTLKAPQTHTPQL